MNKMKAFATVGLASAALTVGGDVGYEHFAHKAAPGVEACADKYLEHNDLLERCKDNVPFVGGTYRMGLLTLVGILGMAGSIGLSLNSIRVRDHE